MRESYPSVQDLQSMTLLAESWMLQILDTQMGFLNPSRNIVINYLFSCLKNVQNQQQKSNIIILLSK